MRSGRLIIIFARVQRAQSPLLRRETLRRTEINQHVQAFLRLIPVDSTGRNAKWPTNYYFYSGAPGAKSPP
jgi:hypothetical protein